MAACTFVPHVNFCELQLLAVNKREVCSGRALLKLCTYCMPGLGLAKAWKAQSLATPTPSGAKGLGHAAPWRGALWRIHV